jgi:hypothetical protein
MRKGTRIRSRLERSFDLWDQDVLVVVFGEDAPRADCNNAVVALWHHFEHRQPASSSR